MLYSSRGLHILLLILVYSILEQLLFASLLVFPSDHTPFFFPSVAVHPEEVKMPPKHRDGDVVAVVSGARLDMSTPDT